jgi:hypothetical protein
MISFNPLPNDTYHGSADDTSGELRRLAPGTVSMKKRIRLNNNGSLRILPVLRWRREGNSNRHIANCTRADPAFSAGFAKALNSLKGISG